MASELSTPPIQLTFLEKVAILPAVCKVAVAAILSIFRTKDAPPSLRLRFWYTVLRTLNTVLTVRQQQYVLGYTDQVYRRFAEQEKFEPDTVALKKGALGHWMGNKNAKNVIIYFHGGGFGEGAADVLFYHLRDVLNGLNAAGKDASVFFVTYGLSPKTIYPQQQEQGVEALRYILQETGRSPSNVALGGDSAGGNICLAILSHISHPHPAIEPLTLSEPLAAVFVTAPWVSFDITTPSMSANLYKDFVSPAGLKQWSDSFLAGQERDNYNEAINAPAEWWKDIKTKHLLICVGKDDVLFSGIDEFARKITSANSNVSYLAAEGEPHDTPLIWRVAGEQRLSEQEKRINAFLREQL